MHVNVALSHSFSHVHARIFEETTFHTSILIWEKPMNQTVYILILISLVFLVLYNKYEKETLQRLLLAKDIIETLK